MDNRERIARTIIGGRWTIKEVESGGLAHLLIIDYYSQNATILNVVKNATDYFFVSHERIIQQISCIFVIA